MKKKQLKHPLIQLFNHPIFTSREARAAGIHPSLLTYYAKQGVIKRISRGVYRVETDHSQDFLWTDLVEAVYGINGGVICLVSALAVYELTDEMDVYMHHPELTKDDLETLNQILGNRFQIPTSTPMDDRYRYLITTMESYPQTSQNYQVFSIVLNEIRTLGSQGSFSDLAEYVKNFLKTVAPAFPQAQDAINILETMA